MGIIDKVIPQKTLDLEYNFAKIIASPYDYKLSKRLMLRDTYTINKYFNIFKKTNATELLLASKLGLCKTNDYMKVNPHIPLKYLTLAEQSQKCIDIAEESFGMCGTFIEYNNLNIDENILVRDLSYVTKDINTLKDRSYLKSLEVWQLKGISKDSLIPNLLYLATEYFDKDLEYLENIKFAEEKLSIKEAPVLDSFRDIYYDENLRPNTLLDASMFLISQKYSHIYNCKHILDEVCDDFYRLGLVYAVIYGTELLYYLDSMKNAEVKNALEELLSIGYMNDTFCSTYLYQIDGSGHVVINENVKSCFIDDNKIRFDKIRTLLNFILKEPVFSNEIHANYDYSSLPIFFMRMIASMHSYAYQIARIKHATLLYKKAKENGVIDKNEFDSLIEYSSDSELFSSSKDKDKDSDINNELLNLTSALYDKDKSMSSEEFIEKEKTVSKDNANSTMFLNAADLLKKDLYDSPYDYDIVHVENKNVDKESYNFIANNIKFITSNLIKQIKEIKTYNTGGKQNGLLVGKLDKKNIWKYKTDSHIFYNNNYKVKEMDLAFGCILDESGSMCGEKIKNGRIVMIMLHEVFNSLGINHSIIGHTSNERLHSKIFKYYQFKEESTHSLGKPYGLVHASNRAGNCDSGALYYMQSLMKKVRNKDKIVIIFSDGQPTECTDLELTKQVENMEKNGIHVIGVGINFKSIKEYYPDNANGKNLKEMVDIVISILKRYVLEKKDK